MRENVHGRTVKVRGFRPSLPHLSHLGFQGLGIRRLRSLFLAGHTPPDQNDHGLQPPGPERCGRKGPAAPRSPQPPAPPSLDPPASHLPCRPRPAPAFSLAEPAGRASPGFKGPARRAALQAAAGPGLAACGGGCPEEAATVAAAVRPRSPGPQLPSCQVGHGSARAAPPLPS